MMGTKKVFFFQSLGTLVFVPKIPHLPHLKSLKSSSNQAPPLFFLPRIPSSTHLPLDVKAIDILAFHLKIILNPLGHNVNPIWDEKLKIPLPYDKSINECTLHTDIVHAKSDGQDNTKPLIGSAKLPLAEVVDEVGIGRKFPQRLKLKKPSRRPWRKLEVKVAIKEIER